MKTKKQEELVNSFLSAIDDETRPLYQDIIIYLVKLGYNPLKERTNISFKHDLHNKQIAKIGIKKNKEHSPFFSLRFSACSNYCHKFEEIVIAYINKYPTRSARCVNNNCDYCKGEAKTHVYKSISDDGESKEHCGAYSLEIPNLTIDDIEEIKQLIKEEHEYLLKNEVGICL